MCALNSAVHWVSNSRNYTANATQDLFLATSSITISGIDDERVHADPNLRDHFTILTVAGTSAFSLVQARSRRHSALEVRLIVRTRRQSRLTSLTVLKR